MNALSTAAALTVLAATTVAVPAQTGEQPSPQTRSVSNDTPGSYQHQHAGVFRPFSEVSAKSGAALCQHKREAMKDTATSTAFAATAAQDGMVEVGLAGLALRKSRNDQVQQLAQKMALDYAQANGGLDSIVKCEGLFLPTELDAKHDVLVKSFDAKSGREFDKAYLKHIVENSSEAVALFESASKSDDPDVAAFAQKGLSMLREHQLLADNLRAVLDAKVASAH